jgi:membrane fusion protein, multidrug efflux system
MPHHTAQPAPSTTLEPNRTPRPVQIGPSDRPPELESDPHLGSDGPRHRQRRVRDLSVAAVGLLTLAGIAGALTVWKQQSSAAGSVATQQAEPVEIVTTELAEARNYRSHTTSIGTILALRSITLSNEIAGTVREVRLTPGSVVEAGELLVALDVSVEEAELRAHEAQAVLAESSLARLRRLVNNRAAPEAELERAQAERDVARAQIARTKAVIERKTIRAPFRARVGLADVHPGQFLDAGTALTTLQSIDDSVHVDFAVSQQILAGLRAGEPVEIFTGNASGRPLPATIVAADARIDTRTRNAVVRARLADATQAPPPGASVRVRVPHGATQQVAVIPANALRKGPGGDQVWVIESDEAGRPRAHARPVQSGHLVGDQVLILSGLTPGERVAAAGSFKLRENVLVSTPPERTAAIAE